MKDIIDRINYLIEKEGFTIASFSKKIGAKDQTIRNSIVQRKNKPSYEVLSAMCQSFDWLNAKWLLTGEGEYKLNTEIQSAQKANNSEEFFKEMLMKHTKIAEDNATTIKSQQLSIADLLEQNKKVNVLQESNVECVAATGSDK